MNDFVDYILETSNDDFLEAIEAISRSHKEHISEIESLSDKSCNLEYNKLTFYDNKYSTALKDDGPDYLNLTDCDLNFMVDPRTGRGLYDEDSYIDEFPSDGFNNGLEGQCTMKNSPNDNVNIKIEVKNEIDFSYENDEKPVNIITNFENQSTPKGNKLVFVQMSNSPSFCEKIKKSETNVPHKLPANSEKYGKPPFSYSCLIAMALKNSDSGFLPVSEIYNYIIEKFPYFKTAPDGWKNSIRHNLSLNKCFQKIETPLTNGTSRKACLWGLNETKVKRLDEEISKWISNESECFETLRFDARELDDAEHDDLCGSPPPNKILKEMKKESNPFDLKNIHIKVEKIKETSSESLFTDSEDQAWDDIELDKLKPVPSYYYFSNEGSQSAFDSALSFKTVRASA